MRMGINQAGHQKLSFSINNGGVGAFIHRNRGGGNFGDLISDNQYMPRADLIILTIENDDIGNQYLLLGKNRAGSDARMPATTKNFIRMGSFFFYKKLSGFITITLLPTA